MAAEVDLSRIPAELRAEMAGLLPIAWEVCRAVDELSEHFERLMAKWNTELHPQLATPGRPDEIDVDLANAVALYAVHDYAMLDITGRASCQEIEQAMRLLGAEQAKGTP